jgi:hypothetical protein
VDTTGTPEAAHPAGQPGADEPTTPATSSGSGEAPGDPQHGPDDPEQGTGDLRDSSADPDEKPGDPGEAPADEFRYGGGSGYGPGYGEPGDGYGYGYGESAGALVSGPATGRHLAREWFGEPGGERPLPPVVGPTPALRGLPGGPGIDAATGDAARQTPAGRFLQRGSSTWQTAQNVWSDAGVAWQRPLTGEQPAEAEWDAWTPPSTRHGFPTDAGAAGLGHHSGATAGTSPPMGGAAVTVQAMMHPPAKAARTAARTAARAPGDAGRRRLGVNGRALITGAAVVTAIAVLVVTGFVITGGKGASPKPTHAAALPAYPPARPAGADFTTTPSLVARGVFQSLGAVASYGATVVAGGAETGTAIGRTQFFVSTDGGQTWQLAPVSAAGGPEPPTGAVPTQIAAGPAGWLALGPGVSWTSKTGRSWQLTGTSGITPVLPGDRVLTVAATANGFLAAGAAKAGPVIWTSVTGSTWQRLDAGALHLRSPGAVHQIVYAAAHGDNTLIAAQVTRNVRTGKGKKRTRQVAETDVWRSADGGQTWTQVPVPVSNGARNQMSGLASSGAGFVVVRPGTSKTAGPDGVVYVSTTGGTWSYAGKISAGKKARLRLIAVHGSDQGSVVTALAGNNNLFAYRSGDGRSWARTAVLASANVTSLSGVTVATGGNVVAAGAATPQPDSRQGFLAVAGTGPGARPSVIGLAGIRGAAYPQRAVGAIAAAPGLEVAVGSANGQPAIWSAAPGGTWARAAGAGSAVFNRHGQVTLTGVTHGPGGWLAVGGHSVGPAHPVVVFSQDGRTWQAADGVAPLSGAGVFAKGAVYGPAGYVIVGERLIGQHIIAVAWHAPRLVPAKTAAKPAKNNRKRRRPPPLWAPAGNAGNGDLNGAHDSRAMLAVTAGPFGYVAAGQLASGPAVWTSPDGRAWRLHGLPVPSGGSAALTFVTSSGNRIVAMGNVIGAGRSAPLAAVSTDGGKTWQESGVNLPGGSGAVTGLTTAAGRFVAVGTVGLPGGSDVVVLTSTDGTRWKAVAPSGGGLSGPGVQEITALTTAGGQLLGAGFTATQATEDLTLWIAPPTPRASP